MLEPFATYIDQNTGIITNYDNKLERRLSDLKGIFSDEDSYQQMLEKEDNLVYEVFEKSVPEKPGQLAHAVTKIYPGKVGNEYFLTKGHFHVKEETAEIYLGIKGQGGIIMQTKEGDVSYIEINPGTAVYVAPYWGHRTINTGNEPFTFFAVYLADAGHDYGTIEQSGFPKIVIEENAKSTLIENPKYG